MGLTRLLQRLDGYLYGLIVWESNRKHLRDFKRTFEFRVAGVCFIAVYSGKRRRKGTGRFCRFASCRCQRT